MSFLVSRTLNQLRRLPTKVLPLYSVASRTFSTSKATKSDQDYERIVLEINDDKEQEIIYNEWSQNYDDYLFKKQYYAPSIIASKLFECLTDNASDLKLLDFGCGTGLVGEEIKKYLLNKKITNNLDGVDTSQGMLNEASKKNVYNNLTCLNLVNNKMDDKLNYYDVVLSSGVFIDGHVSFNQIPNLLQYIKNNGLMFLTYSNSWKNTDKENYEKFITNNDNIEIMFDEKIPYIGNEETNLIVFSKVGGSDSFEDSKKNCKGKLSFSHTYAELSPLKFMELVIPLDYGQFQDNFIEFSREYFNRLVENDNDIKKGNKINYIDVGSAYGNTIIAFVTQWKWTDVLSYWLQREYKELQLPYKEQFNTLAIDGSELSLVYGQKKGIFDEIFPQDFNKEWNINTINGLKKSQILTCFQTSQYMKDGVFEKVLREYYLDENSRKGKDKVIFYNQMCAFQPQDLSPQYLFRDMPNIEHKRIFIKHRNFSAGESVIHQGNKESWTYLYAVYAKAL